MLPSTGSSFLPYLTLILCLTSPFCAFEILGEVSGNGDFGKEYSYLYIGETLHLNCTLNTSDTWQAKDLCFTLEDEDSCSFNDSVEILDERTLHLTHKIRGENDTGEYFCWVRTGQNNLFVNSLQVYVQSRPHSVSFSSDPCFVMDWDESLTCQWSYGAAYIDHSDIPDLNDVSVFVLLSGNWYPMPCSEPVSVHDGTSQCTWSGDQYPGSSQFSLGVLVKNRITNDTAFGTHLVVPANIVKPSPPIDLMLRNKTSACIELSWRHGRIIREKFFSVTVDNQNPKRVNETTAKLCGFKPFTKHTVSVRCHPDRQHGFWSEAATLTFTTSQSIPSSSFEVHPGSYLLGPCKDGRRNVTVFWKSVPSHLRNGEITGYRLIYNGTTMDVKERSPTSAVLPDIPCDANFSVRIFSTTKVGPSATNAKLYIDPEEEAGMENLAVELAENGVRVMWDNSSVDNDTHVTVFWCLKDKTTLDRTCKNEIQWLRSPYNAGSVRIPLAFPGDRDRSARDFLFGVSANARAISWADCYFRKNAPIEPPIVRANPTEEFVAVSWSALACSERHPVNILGYFLHYCQEDKCASTKETVEVKGAGSDHFNLRGEAGRTYNITVQAVDSSGRQGPLSLPVIQAMPQPLGAAEFPWWAVLLIVSISMMMVTVMGLWFYCRCYLQMKQMKGKFGKLSFGSLQERVWDQDQRGNYMDVQPYASTYAPSSTNVDSVEEVPHSQTLTTFVESDMASAIGGSSAGAANYLPHTSVSEVLENSFPGRIASVDAGKYLPHCRTETEEPQNVPEVPENGFSSWTASGNAGKYQPHRPMEFKVPENGCSHHSQTCGDVFPQPVDFVVSDDDDDDFMSHGSSCLQTVLEGGDLFQELAPVKVWRPEASSVASGQAAPGRTSSRPEASSVASGQAAPGGTSSRPEASSVVGGQAAPGGTSSSEETQGQTGPAHNEDDLSSTLILPYTAIGLTTSLVTEIPNNTSWKAAGMSDDGDVNEITSVASSVNDDTCMQSCVTVPDENGAKLNLQESHLKSDPPKPLDLSKGLASKTLSIDTVLCPYVSNDVRHCAPHTDPVAHTHKIESWAAGCTQSKGASLSPYLQKTEDQGGPRYTERKGESLGPYLQVKEVQGGVSVEGEEELGQADGQDTKTQHEMQVFASRTFPSHD